MTLEDFQRLAESDTAPDPALCAPLLALLHDRRGDWETAHRIVANAGCTDGDRVHAYLHRKHGDHDNAAYWYRRANCGAPEMGASLDREWNSLAQDLLGR